MVVVVVDKVSFDEASHMDLKMDQAHLGIGMVCDDVIAHSGMGKIWVEYSHPGMDVAYLC